MEYKQIKTQKIYEKITEALLEGIRNGTLKPGDKLDSVQALAEHFQVGRSAVREALSALKGMGLIEMRQGEGTFVLEPQNIVVPSFSAHLNRKEVENLLEVRRILEYGAAMAAARNRSEEDLALMRDALEKMKQVKDGDAELGEEADLTFHLALASATKNPLLSDIYHQISDLLEETMKETRRLWIYSKHSHTKRLYKEHLEVYKAIQDQDDVKAANMMISHLTSVESVLKKSFGETTDGK